MGKSVNKTLQTAALAEGGMELGHVSGPLTSFRTNGDPLAGLTVSLKLKQSGSGDPSPNNIRPISGQTGVVIRRSGKNLAVPRQTYAPGTTATSFGVVRTVKPDGTVHISGAYNGQSSVVYTIFSPMYGEYAMPPGTYILTGCPAGGGSTTYNIRVSVGGTGTGNPEIAQENGSGVTFTLTEYTKDIYITIRLRNTWMEGKTSLNLDFPLMIRRQGDNADYEPADASTAEIPFPEDAGTVYGGTLDVTKGLLTVTWARVNLGGLSYTSYVNSTGKGLFRFALPDRVYGNNTLAICDSYKFNGNGTMSHLQSSLPDLQFGFQITNTNCWVRNDAYRTEAEIKEALSGVYLAYPVAEPRTFRLTPQEVCTLRGMNRVWADTGDVDVTYTAVGGEGGKLAILLRRRRELPIALRKGLAPAELLLAGIQTIPFPALGSGTQAEPIYTEVPYDEEENE